MFINYLESKDKVTDRQLDLIIQYFKSFNMKKPFNAERRICKYPGCNTILSQYNFFDYCYLHKRITILEDR